MVQQVLLAVIFAAQPSPETGIVARAEKTELRRSDGRVIRRVERDSDGRVTGLRLNEMRLSREDIEELGRLTELRQLVLYRTNFGDSDLKHLAKCPHIESLNLTSTSISDEALKDISEFRRLRYLCLGNVHVSPPTVKALKGRFQSRGQEVHLGYSQRKQ